ncbi:hypothetical protein BZG36_00040 [Bifiguratus adelaidae]|uniref:Uncharacterized protein n=1 Tax=Bifiguratus adelaidae TaxID=1938954 RepID=A0A261Y883_9FUNG|nr:hypothetical protein BZG36_00040 [Bifiguratus adelaidae]
MMEAASRAQASTLGKRKPYSGDPDAGPPGDADADGDAVEARDRIMVVKGSITGIGWRNDLIPVLQEFVTTVHTTTFHAFSFAKYIFMAELDEHPEFDMAPWINKDFISEIWLSLVQYQEGRVRERTARFRGLIRRHLQGYLQITGYVKIPLQFAQQSALIEGKKMYVAYTNIKMRFGQHLQRVINVLLDINNRKQQMNRELIDGGLSAEEAKDIVRQAIILPATQFKEAISHRRVVLPELLRSLPIFVEAYNTLQPVLEAYNTGYQFRRDNIYYDVKASPVDHFRAFHQLARLLSFEKCAYSIDSKILSQNILGSRWMNGTEKSQGVNGQLQFRGTIQTDGVGVSIIKNTRDSNEAERATRAPVIEPDVPYVTTLGHRQHQQILGRCVTVDPGRRDLIYCVHETSTAQTPRKFRFTRNCEEKMRKTNKYAGIRQAVKDANPAIQEAETILSRVLSQTIHIDNFNNFLQTRGQQAAVLTAFYAESRTSHVNSNFLFRKLRMSSYINRVQADQKIVRALREKFENAVLIMGNWSAPHTRYHEPIRGVGMRKMLKKHDFDVFKTSRCCPTCQHDSSGNVQANPKSSSISTTANAHRDLSWPSQMYQSNL